MISCICRLNNQFIFVNVIHEVFFWLIGGKSKNRSSTTTKVVTSQDSTSLLSNPNSVNQLDLEDADL